MIMLSVFDIATPIPEETTVSVQSCYPGALVVRLVTDRPRAFRESFGEAAESSGYRFVRETAGYAAAVKGDRRVELNPVDSGWVISARDSAALPVAEYSGTTIALVGVFLDVGTTSVTPGREHHVPGSQTWSAEWFVAEVGAPELIASVQKQLVRERSLTPGATFAPPLDGEQTWRSEAYSDNELFKLRATRLSGGANLVLEVVRPRLGG